MVKKLILYSLLFNSLSLLGQEIKDTTQAKNYNNAVFVEILGATGYLSVNYERNFSLLKRLKIKPGVGVGYADDSFSSTAPQLISYIAKLDISYKINKLFSPVIGYAFAHNFEVGSPSSFRAGCEGIGSGEECQKKYNYKLHSLSVGIDVTIYKRFVVTPRYYALFEKRSDHPDIIFINWSGLQLKYGF